MSSVENLNKVFLEFCDDLENVIPDKLEYINNARNRIKDKPSTKYYLEYFFRHCLPYASAITSCYVDSLKDMKIMHGITFGDIYGSGMQLASRHALWRYLHTFYLLVQSFPKVNKIAEKYADNEHIESIKSALASHDENLRNIMNSSGKFAEEILKEQASQNPDGKIPDMSSFLNGMDEKKFEESFLNSSIGDLAKEISQDLNADDLKCMENPDDLMKNLMGGGASGAGGLGNIIQKVSDKLQTKMKNGELNEDALMKEATAMMGMLSPAMAGAAGGKGGMGGMGDLFSMMGGMMGGGGGKKKSKKSRRTHKN